MTGPESEEVRVGSVDEEVDHPSSHAPITGLYKLLLKVPDAGIKCQLYQRCNFWRNQISRKKIRNNSNFFSKYCDEFVFVAWKYGLTCLFLWTFFCLSPWHSLGHHSLHSTPCTFEMCLVGRSHCQSSRPDIGGSSLLYCSGDWPFLLVESASQRFPIPVGCSLGTGGYGSGQISPRNEKEDLTKIIFVGSYKKRIDRSLTGKKRATKHVIQKCLHKNICNSNTYNSYLVEGEGVQRSALLLNLLNGRDPLLVLLGQAGEEQV